MNSSEELQGEVIEVLDEYYEDVAVFKYYSVGGEFKLKAYKCFPWIGFD